MLELFSLESLFTLAMLVFLQAVLGFDNLLYISIESKRVQADRQSYVRRLGISFAIILRIVLLLAVLFAIEKLQDPFLTFGIEPTESELVEPGAHSAEGAITVHHDQHKQEHGGWRLTERGNVIAFSINVHSLIVLLGGIFVIYTAFKEIFHMLSIEDIGHGSGSGKKQRSVAAAIFWIMAMNLVFSFDSILSAIALARDNVPVMVIAIVVSGVLMIVLADRVAEFLKKNRMYEVLGLFILLIVGVMLVSEGGHLAHLHFFKYEILAMSKSTFYFVVVVLVIVDIVQSRYQKKLMREKNREIAAGPLPESPDTGKPVQDPDTGSKST